MDPIFFMMTKVAYFDKDWARFVHIPSSEADGVVNINVKLMRAELVLLRLCSIVHPALVKKIGRRAVMDDGMNKEAISAGLFATCL